MSFSLISIVLPVYNQADHIKRIVDEHVHELRVAGLPFEILLIPNGCTDNSEHLCQSLSSQHAQVRCIMGATKGWGSSCRAGLAEAKGDLLCFTNAARTRSADLLAVLKLAVATPLHVIKAKRTIREDLQRRLGSRLYNLEGRLFFGIQCGDINGTPKVFPRTFSKLLALQSNNDLLDLEFCRVCVENNYPLLEVPILSTHRHGGQSTTRYNSAWKMYLGAFQMWFHGMGLST